MSSKIEVSRELIERILNEVPFCSPRHELQDLLDAAPVVERQPVEVLGYSVVGNRYAIAATKGEITELHEGYADHMIELVDIKHITRLQTELAELQATIARLTAENEAVKFNLDKTDKRYLAAVAEIERLKGGQSEAVAWPCWSCKAPITMANRADADGNCPHCEAELDLEDWPASQPAPVSVVLPDGYMIAERSIWTEEQAESAAKCITMLKNVPGMTDRDLALAAMDAGQCKAPDITLSDLACLDKVKELNQ